MEGGEKVIRSELAFSGRLIKVRVDEVLLPSGRVAKREIVVHRGAVAIVGVDGDRILMERQYRHAAGKPMWEIPAGTLEEGEDPMECAKRELLEETGYTAESMEEVMHFYVAVGYSTEVIHLFVATGLKKTKPSPEEDETIRTEMIPFDQVLRMVKSNEIEDAKTIIGIMMLLLKGKMRAQGQSNH
ncbi:MAG: NUDIX hydrolase [Candidatus Methanomethyliales bacterium]|nr:NUDIX hydrolase [Candidatus Methanomethylicales archaeon]